LGMPLILLETNIRTGMNEASTDRGKPLTITYSKSERLHESVISTEIFCLRHWIFPS